MRFKAAADWSATDWLAIELGDQAFELCHCILPTRPQTGPERQSPEPKVETERFRPDGAGLSCVWRITDSRHKSAIRHTHVILAGLALVFMCLRSPAPASPQALSVANKGTIILDEVFARHSEKSANRARLDSFGSGVIQSRIGRAAAPDHIGLDDRQRRACRNCSNPSYTKAGSSRSMAGKVSFSRQ
jgi:hypothetical protein